MRRSLTVSLLVALVCGVTRAAEPDTRPVSIYGVPPAEPINSNSAALPLEPVGPSANAVILVLPIASPGSGNYEWVGRGIQQDLVADLSQMTHARVVADPSARAATDERQALDAARQINAAFVLYGQSQISNNQMRVTGELMDTATGRPLAALKATAPVDQLFPLEDSLAAQAAQALPPPPGMPRPTPQAPQTQPALTSSQYDSDEPLPVATPNAQDAAARESSAPPPVDPPADSSSPYYSYTQAVPPTYYTYNTYYTPYYWGYPYYPYYSPWWGGVGVGIGFGYYGGWNHYYHGYYGRPYYGHAYYGRPSGGFHGGFSGGHGGGRVR